MYLWLITAATMLLVSMAIVAEPFQPYAPLPEQPPIPADNPQRPDKIALGQQLFFDPRLSIGGTHSCNSCHNLAGSGDDGRAVPIGANGRKGTRNTLTIWNAAYNTAYNWDAGAPTLEVQARAHILDPSIMGMPDGRTVVARIRDIPDYRKQFDAVFGGKDSVTLDNVARALAAFERTLATRNSAFDRYIQGDRKALSASAQRGFQLFTDYQCASCHFWVNMAGPVPGLAFKQGEGFFELFPNHPGSDYERRYGLADDQGQYHATLNEDDRRKWRVPSLRNIALTAPYFHNGSVKTLDEAVRVMAKVQVKAELTEQEVADIVEFLNALTGEFPDMRLPRLPGLSNQTALAGHDQ